MRGFSEAFDALRFADYGSVFWTVEVDFAGGTRRFSTTPVTFDDHPYSAWIMDLGEIGSSFSERKAALSLSEMRLVLTNLEDDDSDERFSGFVGDDFESIIFRVYLHFESAPGQSVRELFFLGVPQANTDWSVTPFNVTLTSLPALYLSRIALRTLSDADNPAIRIADIGQPIPFVFGSVPKFPTRITSKGSGASIEADPDNHGSGQLLQATVGANAVDEVWTLELTASETVGFDSGSSTAEVGKSTGTSIGSLTDPGGDLMPSLLGTDSMDGETLSTAISNITVAAGGSNRFAIIAVAIRALGAGGVPKVNSISRDGQSGTFVTKASTGDLQIEFWKIQNPNSGSSSATVIFDREVQFLVTWMTWSNVHATLSFLAANAATHTAPTGLVVTPKLTSGPAYTSIGIAVLDDIGTLIQGAGQTIRGGVTQSSMTAMVTTKATAAASSGTSVPADPATATMQWQGTGFVGENVTLLGGFMTIRGVITGTLVTSGGVNQNFTVPSPGMTVTSVATRLFRDFPLATTITIEIDGTQFAQVSSVAHGQTGAVVTGFGSRALTAGSHTLTFKASGSAFVYRRGTTHQVAGVQRDAYGQSWQTAGSLVLVGVRTKIARNPACALAQGTVRAIVCANSGSNPVSATVLGSGTVQVSSTSQAFVTIALPSLIIPAATRFWVVLLADQDASGKGSILWGRNTSGGYANGNANYGVYAGSYDDPGTISWQGGLSSQDFKFELVFADDVYTITGSVSGSQGTGLVSATSTSSDGRLTIPNTAWLGEPTAGDRFYVTVVVQDGRAIVCESPVDTPIQGLGAVYWNSFPIEETGGLILDIDDVDADEPIGAGGAVVGQTFRFPENQLLKELLLPLKEVGTAQGTHIIIQLVEANAVGTAPGESSTVLGNYQVPIAGITGSYADKSVSLADRPILARAGVSYAVILSNPDGAQDSSNCIKIAKSTTPGAYADGNAFKRDDTTAGGWNRNTQDTLNLRIRGVTVTKDLSVDDGTGEHVAQISFDCQIPDEVIVLADVTGGITDDSAGTYTGTPGSLIRVPSHVVYWCLASRMLVPVEYIDLDMLASTAAKHGSVYRFDGAITQNATWLAVFLRMGFEARCSVDWPEDKFLLQYLESAPPGEPNFIIGPEHIVRQSDGRPMLKISRTPPEDILNAFVIRWSRRFAEQRSETAYDRDVKRRDEDSIAVVGERSGEQTDRELFFMDLTRKQDMAEDQGDFYKSRFAKAKQPVQVTGKYPFLGIRKGDFIAFDLARSRYKSQVMRDAPLAYFPLDDTDLVMRDASGNGLDGAYSADVVHGQPSLIEGDEETLSSSFPGTPDQGLVDLPAIGVSWAIEVSIKTTVDQVAILAGCAQLALAIAGSAGLILIWQDADGNSVFLQTDVPLHDGERHHILASHAGNQTFIMVDGEIQARNTTDLTSAVIGAAEWRIGSEIGSATDYEGLMQHVAIYDSGPQYVRAVAHDEAAADVN